LIPYAAYLLAVYYFSYWLPLTSTLVCATLVWLAFAALLLVSWTRLNPAMA
ncbi:GlpM family protein, partial [Vibrio anguillarum]